MEFFAYKIRYWDDLDDKMNTSEGFCVASSHADAMIKIGNYYGAKSVDNVLLVTLECGDCILPIDDGFPSFEELTSNPFKE